MKQTLKVMLSLVVMAAISFGVLWGGDTLTASILNEQQTAKAAEVFGELLGAERFERLSADSFKEVTAAYRGLNEEKTVGYGVTVAAQGYGGSVEVHVALSADGKQVRGIRIGSHRETPGYGARIETEGFLKQFAEVQLPVFLKGETQSLLDGTYRAAAQTIDESGFRDVVELTVKNGEISAVNWDGVSMDGSSKKELSKSGEYVMTEDGLPWHEQAGRMEEALLRTQNPAAIVYDPQSGKTDAYSGASIRVDIFAKLATQALEQAKGEQEEGTAVDGLSGATVSSKAVVAAVNVAAAFVQRQGGN